MASSEAMTSSTHAFAYSYRCFQKCFVKFLETSKCHNFLILSTDFHQVFTVLFENFYTLSSEIKLNLFRISPLRTDAMHAHAYIFIRVIVHKARNYVCMQRANAISSVVMC